MRIRLKQTIFLLGICFLLAGCGRAEAEPGNNTEESVRQDAEGISYTDALGRTVSFSAEEIAQIQSGDLKVAVLNGSFAEIWSIAGGKLSAVTEDAYDDTREITIDDATVNAGTMKNPSLETLLSADIGLAVLSADVEDHVAMAESLQNAGIRTVYNSVETFDDYLEVLSFYTQLTGCADRYETYGAKLAEEIEAQIARQDGSRPTVLFIRAYSTGAKAKGSDNMTGIMLKELGCINIADEEEQLTDDLSMEVILEKDPDYIFVTTMGSDEEAALASVQALLLDNPAWSSLQAVQSGHYYVLPKNRFHNKPNQRWAESYQMLADILYPESSNEE